MFRRVFVFALTLAAIVSTIADCTAAQQRQSVSLVVANGLMLFSAPPNAPFDPNLRFRPYDPHYEKALAKSGIDL